MVNPLAHRSRRRSWPRRPGTPYRPAANLQFWKADVAYAPEADWQRLRGSEYPIYAPPLIIEVLSPSNTSAEINRRRIAAFSGGTVEFWLIDADLHTIEVSIPGHPACIYHIGENLKIAALPGVTLSLQELLRISWLKPDQPL